jgi:1L-myo-inositol 1-phosphate cytidylyltransferase
MIGAIIAAGYGSRLWNVTNNVPKTLLPYRNGTILSTIINRLQAAGIASVYLVVGYNQSYIRDYISQTDFSIPIMLVENKLWDKGNALSVYQIKDLVKEEIILLSMSDHIVSIPALKKIVNAEERTNLLLADPYITDNFDLADATKLLIKDSLIEEIGKNLTVYNALDCGVFRLERDFFTSIEQAATEGNDSISAAVSKLCHNKRIKAIPMDKPDQWLDIDTPEAYEYALSKQEIL